jgi:hypothetical protein
MNIGLSSRFGSIPLILSNRSSAGLFWQHLPSPSVKEFIYSVSVTMLESSTFISCVLGCIQYNPDSAA